MIGGARGWEGTKYKNNRKGQVQRFQTGKSVWPRNMFCLTLLDFVTGRLDINIYLWHLFRISEDLATLGLPFPMATTGRPTGRVCAPRLPGATHRSEYK